MGKLVSVVIPNWNGRQLLKVCLRSLERQTFKDFGVVVVDNGSEDGSNKYIEEHFPKVKLIKLDRNYGFAKAVNIGIKSTSSKYLFLLNNDTEVDKDCLRNLVKTADLHPKAGFIAPKVLNFYKRNIIDSAGDGVDVVGHSYNIGMGDRDGAKFNTEKEVFLVTAGAGLFKREVFNKIGLFDEDYFTYMEDIDLCLRAQLAGYKGWYTPKAKVFHIHKATSNKIKPLMEYWQFRNMTQNIIKNFPAELILHNFNWLKIILVNINTILYQAINGYFWQAVKAEVFILFNLPKLLKKRVEVQRKKVVTDKYIIDNFLPKKITFFGLLK